LHFKGFKAKHSQNAPLSTWNPVGSFLPSTYEIWKMLVATAKKNIANFHVLGLFKPKNGLRAKKNFRPSRGVAGDFWTKFEAQLAQPC
jgi:hypothetical protein